VREDAWPVIGEERGGHLSAGALDLLMACVLRAPSPIVLGSWVGQGGEEDARQHWTMTQAPPPWPSPDGGGKKEGG
jgi:hypothetical protein